MTPKQAARTTPALPPEAREALIEALAAALVAAYRENVLLGKRPRGRIGP